MWVGRGFGGGGLGEVGFLLFIGHVCVFTCHLKLYKGTSECKLECTRMQTTTKTRAHLRSKVLYHGEVLEQFPVKTSSQASLIAATRSE